MSSGDRVLLLGRSGKLGYALLLTLAQWRVSVVCANRDRLDLGERAQDLRRFVREVEPRLILNAAAFTDVAAAELPQHRDEVLRLNVEVPAELAAAAAELEIPFVHVSTDYVFDGRASSPYTEEDQPAPLQVYGASKLEGERAVLAAHPRALVVRTSTLFGDRFWGRPSYVQAILEQARRGGTLRVVEAPVSSPTYTLDLAQAIFELLERRASGIVHAVNDGSCSRLELARATVTAAGLAGTVGVEARPAPAGDVPRPAYSVLDTGRLRALVGCPLRPWSEAVTSFVQRLCT